MGCVDPLNSQMSPPEAVDLATSIAQSGISTSLQCKKFSFVGRNYRRSVLALLRECRILKDVSWFQIEIRIYVYTIYVPPACTIQICRPVIRLRSSQSSFHTTSSACPNWWAGRSVSGCSARINIDLKVTSVHKDLFTKQF